MSTFKLSVVTHKKKEMEMEVEYLRVRASEGDMGILPNHAPLVTELGKGEMEIKTGGTQKKFFVSGGFLEILNNHVTIIADSIKEV